LTSDSQYEEAFKEWWANTFKKPYDREEFVSWTKQYVDAGLIGLSDKEKDGLRFSGAAKAVRKRYRLRTAS